MRKLQVYNANKLHNVLKNVCAQTHDSRLLHRMHCVLLVGRGNSCYQVGEWFQENPRTIERWVHNFNELGIEGLMDEPTGRPAKISEEQFRQLQKDILKDPGELGFTQKVWDGKLLRTYLKYYHDTELSVRQCQRLLHQIEVLSD